MFSNKIKNDLNNDYCMKTLTIVIKHVKVVIRDSVIAGKRK